MSHFTSVHNRLSSSFHIQSYICPLALSII